jgi:hypothetical protein
MVLLNEVFFYKMHTGCIVLEEEEEEEEGA